MRMMKTMMVMMLVVSAVLPATAEAQRKPLPAAAVQKKMPYKDWDAMAQVFASWHGKLMVATVDSPEKLVTCMVKELTANGVTCKGKHGKDTVFERAQIALVGRPPARVFDWGDLWGLGFGAVIGGSAGFGTAVLCGIGGAALIAAAPLALIAAVAGAAVLVMPAFLTESKPGEVVYQKPDGRSIFPVDDGSMPSWAEAPSTAN